MRKPHPFPLLALAVTLLLAACAGPVPGPTLEPGSQPAAPLSAPSSAGAPRKPAVPEEAQASDPAPTPDELATLAASLESQGPAPELHNQVWLNSEPLKLADLRGQVVIVEFWTYG